MKSKLSLLKKERNAFPRLKEEKPVVEGGADEVAVFSAQRLEVGASEFWAIVVRTASDVEVVRNGEEEGAIGTLRGEWGLKAFQRGGLQTNRALD